MIHDCTLQGCNRQVTNIAQVLFSKDNLDGSGRNIYAAVLRGVIMRNCTLIKKKIKFSSYIRIFRVEQLQRHIFMTNGLLIYGEIFTHFLIYKEALPNIWLCNCSTQNFPIYEENLIFFFISVLRPDVGRNEERGRVCINRIKHTTQHGITRM
jgi:uncharacterized protein YjbI with pentapeptide repeats